MPEIHLFSKKKSGQEDAHGNFKARGVKKLIATCIGQVDETRKTANTFFYMEAARK